MGAGAVLHYVEEYSEAEDAAQAKVYYWVLLPKSDVFDPVGMVNRMKTLVVKEGFNLVRMIVGGSSLCAVVGSGNASWSKRAERRRPPTDA